MYKVGDKFKRKNNQKTYEITRIDKGNFTFIYTTCGAFGLKAFQEIFKIVKE
jgi:hypothetical protein